MSREADTNGSGPASGKNKKKKKRGAPLTSIVQSMCDGADLLPDSELFALIDDFKTNGNLEAGKRAVKANLRLVWDIARVFVKPGTEIIDIVMNGVPGLLRAVEMFQTDRGTKFSTYASYWIKQTMRRAAIDTHDTIRIPQGQHTLYGKILKFRERYEKEFGVSPTVEEIAAGLEKKPKQIIACLKSRDCAFVFSENGLDNDNNDVKRSLFEKRDPNPPPDETVAHIEMIERMIELLASEGTDPRERDILTRRFGLNGDATPQTLKAIGEAIGLTRERVRQIEAEALKRLRKRLNQD